MSVLDPGFEIPALTAGTQWDAPTAGPPVFPPGSPWEFHVGGGSASGIASNGAPIVGTAGAAPDGHQVLYLQHGAKVLQDFTLSAPLAGPVSFFASLNGPTGSLTSGQVYIDVWSGATHVYSQFATISNTVGYQRYTLPELDLAPGAYEIGVTFVGDTDSDVLVDALLFTLPASWLRLVHESGTSWVQQDGTRVQVRANNTEVLDLPLPTLSSAPATLVGQDPTTGLPAFCPPPLPTPAQLLSAPPPPPSTTMNCVQVRCSAAGEMTNHLLSLYDQWATWLDPFFNVLGTAAAGLLIALLLDPLFIGPEAVFLGADALAVYQALKPLLEALLGNIPGGLLPGLTPDQTDAVRKACFCQLTCDNNAVSPTLEQVAGWRSAVGALTVFDVATLTGPLLLLLLQFTPLQSWQIAVQSATTDSYCDAWTCP